MKLKNRPKFTLAQFEWAVPPLKNHIVIANNGELIPIERLSHTPLTLQERRQCYWGKRWSHKVIAHSVSAVN